MTTPPAATADDVRALHDTACLLLAAHNATVPTGSRVHLAQLLPADTFLRVQATIGGTP